jgi:hypothetical protein
VSRWRPGLGPLQVPPFRSIVSLPITGRYGSDVGRFGTLDPSGVQSPIDGLKATIADTCRPISPDTPQDKGSPRNNLAGVRPNGPESFHGHGEAPEHPCERRIPTGKKPFSQGTTASFDDE